MERLLSQLGTSWTDVAVVVVAAVAIYVWVIAAARSSRRRRPDPALTAPVPALKGVGSDDREETRWPGAPRTCPTRPAG